MQNSRSHSNYSFQSLKDLFKKNLPQCIAILRNEFDCSFRNLLVEDQIRNFNPLFVDNKQVIEDTSILGPIRSLDFEDDTINIKLEWTIIFNRIKSFKTRPQFKIKFQDDELEVDVILNSIKYPDIDESF